MRRLQILAAATTAVTAAAVALLGGVLGEGRSTAQATASAAPVSADRALSGFAIGDTAATIVRLQEDVREQPRDGQSLALLGLAYLQRARETGDASYYGRAERRAPRRAPGRAA